MIAIAGGTGDLGGRVVRELRARGAPVRVLVRAHNARSVALEQTGAAVVQLDFGDSVALTRACEGAACVVCTFAGLRELLVDTQLRLVDAAEAAGVPRFIPSDFAADFMKVTPGANRNFDLRQELARRLVGRAIAVTSILNGAFMELLIGPAPFIVFPLRRVLYWGDADQQMDFTALDDVAAFTALAALDNRTPAVLRIAGAEVSARDLSRIASEVTGKRFRPFRGGSIERLERLIRFTRRVSGGEAQLFPAWQGMQYTRDMMSGQAKLDRLDNARYPELRWTPVAEILRRRPALP